MKARRGLTLFIGLAIALTALIFLGRAAYNLAGYRLSWLNFSPGTAYALTDQQDLYGAPTPTAWSTHGCNNDFWSDGSHICDAAGFFPSADFDVSGVRLYNTQCSTANEATRDFRVQIRLNSTGVPVVTSNSVTITCNGAPPAGDWYQPVVDFTFASPFPLNSGTEYALSWEVGTGSAGYTSWTGSNSDGSPIFSFSLLSGSAGPTLSMYWPSDQSATTSIPEFRNWLVDGSGLTSDGIIQVFYSRATSTLFDPISGYVDNSGPTQHLGGRNAIPKNQILWQPPLPIPVTWYVKAVYHGSDSALASSDIQQFSVSPTSSISVAFASSSYVNFYHAFRSTSTDSGVAQCSNATGGLLDDPVGNITDAMCLAFNPDPIALQSFGKLGADISDKPPFGYFTAFKNGLSGISTGTAAVALMSTSTTAAFAGIFSPIRVVFGIMILLIAGFWVWNRARHLEI